MLHFVKRLKEFLKRPVSYAMVFLSYAGIFVALSLSGLAVDRNSDAARTASDAVAKVAVETAVRQAEMCQVVRNVHANAKFRLSTEEKRKESALEYLNDPKVPRDALYQRVKENLASQEQDIRVAAANVEATRVPESCPTKEK